MDQEGLNDPTPARGGSRPGSGRKRKVDSTNNEEILNKIKSMMEKGIPKYVACKKIQITRSAFDKDLSLEQKRILDEITYSFSQGTSKNKY